MNYTDRFVRSVSVPILKRMIKEKASLEDWESVGHLYRALHQTYDELKGRLNEF
jgi:hypothetical protein